MACLLMVVVLNLFSGSGSDRVAEPCVPVLVAQAEQHALDNDFDAATTVINLALSVQPENPALYVERGRIRTLLYEWDAVLDDYNAAIDLDPDYADAYFYRGLLYYTMLVDRELALPDFQRVIDLAPGTPNAEEAAQYLEQIQSELEALER